MESRDTELPWLRMAAWQESAHEVIVAYKTHVYRGMAARARCEAEWARSGLALVDRLEAAAHTTVPAPAAGPTPTQPG